MKSLFWRTIAFFEMLTNFAPAITKAVKQK